ncbi:MAG: Hsp70 family protein, partial [Treponemataceae bacterium]|nr:Hsp70 family protein [Treponemataceae bacterium]
MKKIGIKLADGTFFPILEEGSPEKKEINLTTVKDNQTKVKVDLYRGEKSSIDEAEYLDTLEISKMKKHPNGEPNIGLEISLDEKNELSAKIVDKESGAESQVSLSLLSENKNGKKNSDAENSDEAEGVAIASAPENEATPTEEIVPDFDFTQDDSDETNLGETAEATAAEEIPAEENAAETTTTETPVEKNFSDDLPSLDELDLSLPESSEQDDAIAEDTATIASLPQDDDFSLDENVSGEPPSEENSSEDFAADLDLPDLDFPQDDAPTEEVVQDSALPDLDFPDLSFDESDFSAPKNEIQNEPDSANDDLDFSDMDFELPNFGDTDFSSDEIDSNFDDEKNSTAENSFDSFSENNSS